MYLVNHAFEWTRHCVPRVSLWSFVDNLETTGDDPLDIVVSLVSIQQFCDQLDIQLDDFSVESAMEMDSDVIFIDIFIDYYIIIR